jgi:hypothetical protein
MLFGRVSLLKERSVSEPRRSIVESGGAITKWIAYLYHADLRADSAEKEGQPQPFTSISFVRHNPGQIASATSFTKRSSPNV